MIINKEWAMPSKNTFSIPPIKKLIDKYYDEKMCSVDPFANGSRLATITNDIDPECQTTFHFDALEFLSSLEDNSVDFCFYDPPYSPRQISEVYKKLNLSVNMETTQASYWSNQKREIGRIIKPGGYVLSCSWNSGGIGKKYGFKQVEILLVAHGGWHNDTICVIEEKRCMA